MVQDSILKVNKFVSQERLTGLGGEVAESKTSVAERSKPHLDMDAVRTGVCKM